MEANQCPNCGSPAPRKVGRCDYCGSTFTFSQISETRELSGRACGACAHLNTPDSNVCANCGQRIVEPCRVCHKSIALGSNFCPSCGIVHHAKDPQDSKRPSLVELSTLVEFGDFPEADAEFSRLEREIEPSDEFYAMWVTNYIKWAMSLDKDKTMQGFARLYRNNAEELLSRIENQFPHSQAIERARNLVHKNTAVEVKDKSKGECFVATAVFADRNHPEVVALRNWRDQELVGSCIGRLLVRIYCFIGPLAAPVVRRNCFLRAMCRRFIRAFRAVLRI